MVILSYLLLKLMSEQFIHKLINQCRAVKDIMGDFSGFLTKTSLGCALCQFTDI